MEKKKKQSMSMTSKAAFGFRDLHHTFETTTCAEESALLLPLLKCLNQLKHQQTFPFEYGTDSRNGTQIRCKGDDQPCELD